MVTTAGAEALLVIGRPSRNLHVGNNKLGATEVETLGKKCRAVEPCTSF